MELVARYRRSLSTSRVTREEQVKAIKKHITLVDSNLQKILSSKSVFATASLQRQLNKPRTYLRDLAKIVREEGRARGPCGFGREDPRKPTSFPALAPTPDYPAVGAGVEPD